MLDDPASVATLARQFAMKNTMGYGLNALVDFDTAPQMLAHLVVGSEGTLAFVASATFRTVPLRTHAASALLVFDDLYAANRALPALVATGAATLELMDATSLRVGQTLADCPPAVAALTVDRQAALLVEYQATTADELASLVGGARPVLGGVPLTADPGTRHRLWKLRKGLYTSVAGARRSGTTALLEDVVVPVERLADTCTSLTTLFGRYAYEDAVIFGHAKDGNLHFMLTDRFESGEQLARYAAFTEDLVALVLDNGGSLKAEHGTGRVMAPFVRRQYGDELYDVMREVKRLFDPRGLLNPGVLLSDDPRRPPAAHQAGADGRGGGRPLRRVRLLRAGVPVAGPHPDAAPADRAAPGHPRGGAGRRRRHGRAARARLRVPRRGHLRGRRDVRHRVPGRHQHRPADQDAPPREPVRARAERSGPRRRSTGARRRPSPGPRSPWPVRCPARWCLP